MVSIPPNSIYSDLLNGYFPNTGPTDGQDAIWNAFVAMYGITPTTDLNGTIFLPDLGTLTYKELFGRFIQQTYDSVGLALSPDEIKNRHVVFTVFDILILLMKTSQENYSVMQQAVLNLAKQEQQYSEQISRVGFYRGGSSNIGTVDTTDLSKWTLGYANTTMQDYISAAIVPTMDPSAPINPTIPPTLSYHEMDLWADPSDTVIDGIPISNRMTVTLNVANSAIPLSSPISGTPDMHNKLSFMGDDSQVTFTLSTRIPQYVFNGSDFVVDNIDTTISKTVTFTDPNESFALKLQEATQGFKDFMAQTTFQTSSSNITYQLVGNTIGDFLTNPDMPFHINWPKPFNDPFDAQNNGTHATQKAGPYRAQRNQLLQQYLENARTRKGVLSNMVDTLNTTADAAKQSISQTAEILSSTVQSLQNILTSIFKL